MIYFVLPLFPKRFVAQHRKGKTHGAILVLKLRARTYSNLPFAKSVGESSRWTDKHCRRSGSVLGRKIRTAPSHRPIPILPQEQPIYTGVRYWRWYFSHRCALGGTYSKP